MALIKCTECGNMVSDKADKCPHCGCPVSIILCESEKAPEKPLAEEPAQRPAPVSPQQVEVTGVKVSSKLKLALSAVLIVVVLFGAALHFSNVGEKADYANTLQLATSTMLSGAVKAESVGNLIASVWFNAIYNKADIETDKYTRTAGRFHDDFNESLDLLFTDPAFTRQIGQIEDNQAEVAELMKKLINPPSEYAEAYETIRNYYDAYMKFADLVVDHSGSYSSFSEDFRQADTETVNLYKKMELYIGN